SCRRSSEMNYLTGWYLLGVRNVVCTCSQWRSSSEYMHRCEKHGSLRVGPESIFVTFYPVRRMKSRINYAGLRSLRLYVTTRGSIGMLLLLVLAPVQKSGIRHPGMSTSPSRSRHFPTLMRKSSQGCSSSW